jgi:hypothetical protein
VDEITKRARVRRTLLPRTCAQSACRIALIGRFVLVHALYCAQIWGRGRIRLFEFERVARLCFLFFIRLDAHWKWLSSGHGADRVRTCAGAQHGGYLSTPDRCHSATSRNSGHHHSQMPNLRIMVVDRSTSKRIFRFLCLLNRLTCIAVSMITKQKSVHARTVWLSIRRLHGASSTAHVRKKWRTTVHRIFSTIICTLLTVFV